MCNAETYKIPFLYQQYLYLDLKKQSNFAKIQSILTIRNPVKTDDKE